MQETEKLIERAHKAGARTIINLAPASKISEQALEKLDIIILNEYEADTLGEALSMNTQDKVEFASALYDRFQLVTIITLGPEGAICCDGTYQMHASPLEIKAVDTIGAGDAFSGFLSAALDQGYSLPVALKHASVAGSLACTRIGAQTALPDQNEVERYLEKISVTGYSEDVASSSSSLAI